MTYIPTGFFVYDPIGDRVVFDILQTPQGMLNRNGKSGLQHEAVVMYRVEMSSDEVR
jgi:hypothetical protein